MSLTLKQQRFIDEYLVDGNATRSAIAAGYSKKTAYSIGEENLKKPDIKAEIERVRVEQSKKLEIKREDALNRQNSISKAYEVLLELSLKDKLTTTEEAKYNRLMMVVRAADSTRADEFLSKHLGWNVEDTSVDEDSEIKITIVRKDGNQGNQSI